MIYNVFLCNLENETLIRSYFNDIVSDLATFSFTTKDSNYDTSLRPADTITVYTALVDATTNYTDNSITVTFVAGDTRKKFVNKLFKTILFNLGVDVASVLYDNRFNGWVRTNYPAAIYSILDNESKGLDGNALFSGSSDFMELFYKYQANLISGVDTSYILPVFGMQMITFKNDLQVVVRTGEEKNIALIGNGTVIAVYSHTINPEVEYEYGIVNNKENENDVITFTIGDDIIINGLNIGNTYSDNEGTVGITSVATVSISDMTIEPLTYYYDDFSGGTINCDNEIVSDVKDRYFSIGTIPHKVTGGIELIGASTIFIRSYKYKDADIKMYINPVASDTEFNIHFMKQVASTDVSLYNGHYVNMNMKVEIPVPPTNMVACGEGYTHSLAHSTNGVSWTGLGLSIFDYAYCVAYNGSIWVAGGQGTNKLAWSDDGIVWHGLGAIFTNSCSCICWNGTKFIALGDDWGGNNIAWSTDGKIWNHASTSTFNTAMGIAWNGSVFVAVSNGQFATNSISWSDDGIIWTGLGNSIFTIDGYCVAWNGTKFIAGGSGTNSLASSTDGKVWNVITNNVLSVANGIAWSSKDSRWVVGGVGDINNIAWSDNGIDWTGVGGKTDLSRCVSIIHNGTLFVAMGRGDVYRMMSSSDGKTWAIISNSIFNTVGNAIASTNEPYKGEYWNPPPTGVANHTSTYHRYVLGSDSSSTPIGGLTYPINTSHVFQSTIKDGVLTFKINGDIIFTADVDSPYPEIYDYGYIGIENKTAEKSLIVSKIEINGDEKFGRGIQVGRYIDDFDYNSEGEYR